MILFYNIFVLGVGLFYLPKWLFQCFFHNKYRRSFKQRFIIDIPKTENPSIWLHMVSVGEVRAMLPLYERLKATYPTTSFFLSTVTETGLAEAKRALPDGFCYFILPFDFSWTMRKLAKRIGARLLLLSEGDLWLNMLHFAKKEGARIALVSGKLSERSACRYAKFPFFAKRLFGTIDLFCLQNKTYAERFSHFVPSAKIHITGNLKFDSNSPTLNEEQRNAWLSKLKIKKDEAVVVLGSTHQGEEQLLLAALSSFQALKILLVPRHPERFERVFISLPGQSGRLSQELTGHERIILIDAMGLLNTCYQLATVAIVGGSFVPGIGGHNILEPIQAHIPVVFGPYMQAQAELVDLVLKSGAGMQVTPNQLPENLEKLLLDPIYYAHVKEHAIALSQSCKGACERTYAIISELIP